MRATGNSGGRGRDEELGQESFARAVDGGTRGISHPTLDRELAVVATLRRAAPTVTPHQFERDRMRQRVMAEFPAIVHEGSSPVLPLRRAARRRAVPDDTRGRLVVAAAAALCLLMSLSGMSVLLSRDALPGDALYAFKRSAESAELGLTFGDQGKALKHLEFAGQRVGELEVMADKSGADWTTGGAGFVSALSDFEQDTTAGTRLLTEMAAGGHGADMLASLRGWVEQQQSRLDSLRATLPLPATTRLDSTLVLLDRVVDRIAALERRAGCQSVTSGARDDLGLLPATGACQSPVPPAGTSSAAPLPTDDPSQAPVPGGTVPPGLVAPPSGDPNPDEDKGELRLPTSPGDVLPDPGQSGDQTPALPGDGSTRPLIPLPLPIPLPLLPMEGPQGR